MLDTSEGVEVEVGVEVEERLGQVEERVPIILHYSNGGEKLTWGELHRVGCEMLDPDEW